MVRCADKGLIISTGGFTLEARREATCDGAPPIDLIDGPLLAQKLKELKLGVRTNMVEHVEIVGDWFKSIRPPSNIALQPTSTGAILSRRG